MSMKKTFIYIIFLLIFTLNLSAQVGGIGVYKFLDISPTARLSALGGRAVSISDEDVNMALENPALLNEKMFTSLSLSHKFLFSGTNSGYASYGFQIKKWNLPLHVGLLYVNYGDEEMTNEYGDILGEVDGYDYALVVGTSRQLYERLSVGINTKFIFSGIGTYNSTGIAFDIASQYSLKEKNLTIGLVLKNLGFQLKSFGEKREPIASNVLLGVTKRLKHLPFRFSVTAHHLNRWNLLYDDPNEENNLLNTGGKNDLELFADNVFRHFIFSGEFMIGKGKGFLRLRLSYNYMKAREMVVSGYRSFAGFSFGFGLRIKKIRFDYAYSIEHLIGGKSHLTISTNLSDFRKRL